MPDLSEAELWIAIISRKFSFLTHYYIQDIVAIGVTAQLNPLYISVLPMICRKRLR